VNQLERLQDFLDSTDTNRGHWYGKIDCVDVKRINDQSFRVLTTDVQYIEEEYKGFNIILRVATQVTQPIFCDDGVTPYRGWELQDSQVYGNPNTYEQVWAWAYEIGSEWDSKPLNYAMSFSVFNHNRPFKSAKEGLNKTKKKIDMIAPAFAIRNELNAIADERWKGGDPETPFNVKVGDRVWVHAFGRARKGIVVGTKGRQFSIAYQTPANAKNDPHIKTIPIQWILVDRTNKEPNQDHNFQGVTP
jgi:hypothetical protein